MRRRDFLKSTSGLIAASGFGRTWLAGPVAVAQGAQPAGTRRFIDAHCHFFNAADIPVRGFLERVVFEDYPDTQVPGPRSLAPGLDIPIWRGMVATLIDFLLKSGAPTPRQELQCLAQPSACSDFNAVAPDARQALAPAEAPTSADKTRVLGNVLQDSVQGPRARSLQPSGQADQEDIDAFLNAVLDEMKTQGRLPPETTARSLGAFAEAGIFDNIASFLFGSTLFGRFFRWGRLLTGYRSTIAETYRSTYDTAGKRLILATPALVDYNYWLEDQSPAALRDQVEVMSRLSLREPYPVHGFAPFDPLRELRHPASGSSSLGIVQDAVNTFGFLGVKLYPPMGFRPSGNAEGIAFPAFAHQNQPDFGARLDEALDRLYAWCEAEEVPILAHTLDSQGANNEFGARAEPRFWERVLEGKPALRLNLAHFGNFITAAPGSAPTAEKLKGTWEFEIGNYVKGGRFKNVYADLSYFSWVLGEGAQIRGCRSRRCSPNMSRPSTPARSTSCSAPIGR